MNPFVTTVAAWSYGLAGFGYAAFGLYLWIGSRGALRGVALLAAVALTALWGFLNFAYTLSAIPLLFWIGTAVDVLCMGAWFAFMLLLIGRRGGGNAAAVPATPSRRTWLPTVAAALVVLGLVARFAMALGWSGLGDPGRLVLFDSLALTVFGLMLVEQVFRGASDEARWSLKPLCLGLAGVFIFDLYLFAEALLFSRLDGDAWSVRGAVHALVIPLIALSAARNREWTFAIALSRHVVFHSSALLVSGAYLLLMAGAGYYVRYLGGKWGPALQVALLFAGLLGLAIIVLSGSLRAKLRVVVSKHFFSYRYDYRDEWLRFTQALSARGGQIELGQDVVKGLADMLESPAGALWLRAVGDDHFVQTGRWNMPANPATEPTDSPFVRFLGETGWVVNLEEFRSSPERYRGLEIPPWLSELPNAWVIIPLANGPELIGFVILSTARTRIDVNWEVNDLLKTAARQAATFLGQMQATEALLEARKFDAFNRMSAFVVHDLKNIVAQLSLMLRNVERHRDNPEFQKDMLSTIEHSVERMKHLMLQLRGGTTSVEAAHGIDLVRIVERIRRTKSDQRPISEDRHDELVLVTGHDERLERVIGHLVQNAIDATDKGDDVWIKLVKQDGVALVEVGDTGHGMTPEFLRERLFKPFQTTKETGMGIGAYESFQYVRELGGRVEVESTPGAGTKVRLLLPLFKSPAGATTMQGEVA